jgi:trk system potassium uptake protein TrkA
VRQFAVIGIGRFGYSVAKTLAEEGCQVLAIDIDPEPVQEISDFVTQSVNLDATDEKALRAVGIGDVDVCVVSIGQNKEASIMATLLLKEMGIEEVVCKAITMMHGRVHRIARSLAHPNILDNLELSKDYGIFEIVPPQEFIGKTLAELDIRANFELNVIAIRGYIPTNESKKYHTAKNINISPLADDTIPSDSVLVVVGSNESVERFRKKMKI